MITLTNIVIALIVVAVAGAALFRGVLAYADDCWGQQ
jgi:hypothetical protein